MGWAVGYDSNWQRDIGYGVPSICDHPGCDAEIDRGLAYVCCDQRPYGGERGCGLFFCADHRFGARGHCTRCRGRRKPYTPKPDTREWMRHKLRDWSWKRWRDANPEAVLEIRRALRAMAEKERTT